MATFSIGLWYVEGGELLGSHHFLSPFDTNGSLMGRNAYYRDGEEGNSFFIGWQNRSRWVKRSTSILVERVEGIQQEMRREMPYGCGRSETGDEEMPIGDMEI